jgi:ATP-dependent Clp protease protease subunit
MGPGDPLIQRVADDVIFLNLIAPGAPIHVLIDTDGGHLKTALALYDIFSSSVSPIYTYGLSEVSSAGVLIYSVGAKRYAFPNTQFMTHPGVLQMTANEHEYKSTSEYLTQQAELSKKLTKKVLKIGKKKYDELYAKTTYFGVDFAKKIKLVTDVISTLPADLVRGATEYELEAIPVKMEFDE